MPVNQAAWLSRKRADLEVRSAPYTPPKPDEIVVRNGAIAINPADWIKQCSGDFLFSWVKYPFVLGTDLAGEVVQAGSEVTRFKIGDRVLANAVGIDKKRNKASEGAFQEYTVVLAHMAAPIPDHLSYEEAAVLPLGLSTAACGLFEKDQLALQYPSPVPRPSGRTLLVWGGSTSVGSNAIQLAVAAGYEVITTCGPKNFEYVKALGATEAFDYKSETVCADVINAFAGRRCAGAFAVGAGSAEACFEVVHSCQGNKFVSMATFPISFTKMAEGANVGLDVLRQSPRLVSFNISRIWKALRRGVRSRFIFASSLTHSQVSRIIYIDFLPRALAEGRYVAAPNPLIVGKGLSCVQEAFRMQMQGVSAQKLVVSL